MEIFFFFFLLRLLLTNSQVFMQVLPGKSVNKIRDEVAYMH